MKLLMLPNYKVMGLDNGIGQVLYHYEKYLPKVGIELTYNEDDNFDLSASHLGYYPQADIHFSHGLWFNNIDEGKAKQNAAIINALRLAKAIIVPSQYVAMTLKRDMRISPHVISHGIEVEKWKHSYKSEGYILWNKNRAADACNPKPLQELAKRFEKLEFVSTFCNEELKNVKVTGKLPFEKMKPIIQKAAIYLATARETFGIGTLEALASGIPVLGFEWGSTKDIIEHKKDGYLVKPYDYNALATGLEWLIENRESLKQNCIAKAKQYSWLNVAQKIKEVCNGIS